VVEKYFDIRGCFVGGKYTVSPVMPHCVRKGVCIFKIFEPKTLYEPMEILIALNIVATENDEAMCINEVTHDGLGWAIKRRSERDGEFSG
jgi:hypothetical protein